MAAVLSFYAGMATLYAGAKETKKLLDAPGDAAKRARQTSILKTQEARARADREKKGIEDEATRERKQRRSAIARNETLLTDPLGLGGQAATVRKILTGQ